MAGRHPPSRTIYVGNLPGNVKVRDVEDIFYKVSYANPTKCGSGLILDVSGPMQLLNTIEGVLGPCATKGSLPLPFT